jgi:mono/diheme cytochrome c family protein
MKSNLLVGATILTGAVFIAFGSPARAQEASSGDAINGKRAYLAAGCMYCHGRAGQGGAMNYPAPPLAKTELPVDGFKGVLRQSLRDMPAYVEAVLPDKDVADIYAFLQTLPGRRPAKDIAILND